MSWPTIMPPLKAIPVKPQAWWRIHIKSPEHHISVVHRFLIDIMGPFEMSNNGNRYVAIGVDAFTKYVEAARNMIYMIQNYRYTPPCPLANCQNLSST